MAMIRNLLALIGLIVLVGAGFAIGKLWPVLSEFDPDFPQVYTQFAQKLLTEKDPGVAMMWSLPVEEGLSPDDVKESLKSLASSKSFLFVGEAPFHKQVEAITGEPYRHVTFMSFCDASVGKMMADYRDSYTGFMPCRIAVVEDQEGNLWLHSMNLDLMIHGGKELPPELKKEALRVRDIIISMMEGAAAGEF
ncbi:MAG: DUF302 domain-containing protein [Gammaproteobacteria bacterium]|nr:DUF302 domain-containing protein [Gammaproteobacteria bacterium]